jgi:hypothetical protein
MSSEPPLPPPRPPAFHFDDVEYTFDDYREAFVAQQRSLRPPAGARAVIAWVVFLILLALLVLVLRVGSRSVPPAASPPPPATPGIVATPLWDVALRIVLPLIPWVLIGFLIWFFIGRTLKKPRRPPPVEQYIAARGLPHAAVFGWLLVLLVALVVVPGLWGSGEVPDAPGSTGGASHKLVGVLPSVLVFLFIWLVLFRGIQKANIRRTWSGQPFLHRRKRLIFRDDALEVSDELTRAEARWAAVPRFIETLNLFLLMSGDFSFHIVPKRIFGSAGEVDRFREFLRGRIQGATGGFPVVPLASLAPPSPPAPPAPPPKTE